MQGHKVNPKSFANLRPPWRKGEIPNPTGKNKKRPITDEYYACSEQTMPEILRKRFNQRFGLNLLQPGVTWGKAIALRVCFDAVMEGSARAAKEIREAIEGKAPQRLEISGPERKEIMIQVVYGNKHTAS